MSERINSEPGGEQWLPSQHAMEGAHEYLGIGTEEAGGDDTLAARQFELGQQADAKNAAEASGNFKNFQPGQPNSN